jgi:hypothetical protein
MPIRASVSAALTWRKYETGTCQSLAVYENHACACGVSGCRHDLRLQFTVQRDRAEGDLGAPATLAGTGPYDGWKVVIHPEGNATRTATLTGVQCSSGKPVRFCYESCDWTTSTGRLKTSSLTLRVDVGQHLDYTGYMVFPGPGLMRFSVSDARASMQRW